MSFVKLEPAARRKLSGAHIVPIRVSYTPGARRWPEAVRILLDPRQLPACSGWLIGARHVDVEFDAAARLLRIHRGSTFRILKGGRSAHMVFVRLPPIGRPAHGKRQESDATWRLDGERLLVTLPSWLVLDGAGAPASPVDFGAPSVPGFRMGLPSPEHPVAQRQASIPSRDRERVA